MKNAILFACAAVIAVLVVFVQQQQRELARDEIRLKQQDEELASLRGLTRQTEKNLEIADQKAQAAEQKVSAVTETELKKAQQKIQDLKTSETDRIRHALEQEKDTLAKLVQQKDALQRRARGADTTSAIDSDADLRLKRDGDAVKAIEQQTQANRQVLLGRQETQKQQLAQGRWYYQTEIAKQVEGIKLQEAQIQATKTSLNEWKARRFDYDRAQKVKDLTAQIDIEVNELHALQAKLGQLKTQEKTDLTYAQNQMKMTDEELRRTKAPGDLDAIKAEMATLKNQKAKQDQDAAANAKEVARLESEIHAQEARVKARDTELKAAAAK